MAQRGSRQGSGELVYSLEGLLLVFDLFMVFGLDMFRASGFKGFDVILLFFWFSACVTFKGFMCFVLYGFEHDSAFICLFLFVWYKVLSGFRSAGFRV